MPVGCQPLQPALGAVWARCQASWGVTASSWRSPRGSRPAARRVPAGQPVPAGRCRRAGRGRRTRSGRRWSTPRSGAGRRSRRPGGQPAVGGGHHGQVGAGRADRQPRPPAAVRGRLIGMEGAVGAGREGDQGAVGVAAEWRGAPRPGRRCRPTRSSRRRRRSANGAGRRPRRRRGSPGGPSSAAALTTVPDDRYRHTSLPGAAARRMRKPVNSAPPIAHANGAASAWPAAFGAVAVPTCCQVAPSAPQYPVNVVPDLVSFSQTVQLGAEASEPEPVLSHWRVTPCPGCGRASPRRPSRCPAGSCAPGCRPWPRDRCRPGGSPW